MKRGVKSPGQKKLVEEKIMRLLSTGVNLNCNRVAQQTSQTFALTEKLLSKLVIEGKIKKQERVYWKVDL